MTSNSFYKTTLGQALTATVMLFLLATFSFFLIEPKVSTADSDSRSFTIEQEITGEVSFVVPPANIQMAGSLTGMTGGTSTASTTAVVKTNNLTGYTLDIKFADSGYGTAMLNSNPLALSPDAIKDHPNVSGEPMYNFNGGSATSTSLFGYNVASTESSDIDPSFLNNGTNCNVGSLSSTNKCWMTPTTSDFRIIDRSYSDVNGATTTINFMVVVPPNPSPAVESGFYYATATLTALTQ